MPAPCSSSQARAHARAWPPAGSLSPAPPPPPPPHSCPALPCPAVPAAAAAKRLLQEGANPCSQDCNQRLPLHFASEAGGLSCTGSQRWRCGQPMLLCCSVTKQMRVVCSAFLEPASSQTHTRIRRASLLLQATWRACVCWSVRCGDGEAVPQPLRPLPALCPLWEWLPLRLPPRCPLSMSRTRTGRRRCSWQQRTATPTARHCC